MKPKVFYAVMCGDETYPDSMCKTREGAESYLGDAKHAATEGAKYTKKKIKVRLVKLTVEDVKDGEE